MVREVPLLFGRPSAHLARHLFFLEPDFLRAISSFRIEKPSIYHGEHMIIAFVAMSGRFFAIDEPRPVGLAA